MLSAEAIRLLEAGEAEADKNTLRYILFIVFSMLSINTKTLPSLLATYMHQLSFLYIYTNYLTSHLLAVRERERERMASKELCLP